jgi:ABC-type transport system involved in cytochrome c biogenesis permease subunit
VVVPGITSHYLYHLLLAWLLQPVSKAVAGSALGMGSSWCQSRYFWLVRYVGKMEVKPGLPGDEGPIQDT